jgi:hypothetical protein
MNWPSHLGKCFNGGALNGMHARFYGERIASILGDCTFAANIWTALADGKKCFKSPAPRHIISDLFLKLRHLFLVCADPR